MTNSDLDRFLAAPTTTALPLPPEETRKIVERFLASCGSYGVEARHLGGSEMHAVVGHVLPARFAIRDPLGPHVGAVLRAFVEFLDAPSKSEQLEALAHTLPEAEEAIRTGEAVHHHHHHEDRGVTFVRDLPKVGRNDPCPCGSSKKFKACHARA